jgi:hypothetical protein
MKYSIINSGRDFKTKCLILLTIFLSGCGGNIPLPTLPIVTSTSGPSATIASPPTISPTETPTLTILPTETPNITRIVIPTPTLTPRAGEDIGRGCIWNHYWNTVPAESVYIKKTVSSCWDFSKLNITAGNGGLDFSIGDSSTRSLNAIYTVLPVITPSQTLQIKIILHINALTTAGIENSDLFFAIGAPQTWILANANYLIYRADNESDSTIYVVQDPSLSVSDDHLYITTYNPAVSPDQEIIFSITENRLNLSIGNNLIIDRKPLDAGLQAFWLGWNLRQGAKLDATLSVDISVISE